MTTKQVAITGAGRGIGRSIALARISRFLCLGLLHLNNDAKDTHALFVSLIQAAGVTGVNQFGHPGGGSGPLSLMT